MLVLNLKPVLGYCSSSPQQHDSEAEKKKSDLEFVKKIVGNHVKARNLLFHFLSVRISEFDMMEFVLKIRFAIF